MRLQKPTGPAEATTTDDDERMRRVRQTLAGLREILANRFPEVSLGFDWGDGTTKTTPRKDRP